MFLRANHGQGDYQAFSGIKVEPQSTDGKDVKVIYDGLLFKSGAQELYMHTGFGKRHQWENVYDHRMERTGRGWEKTIHIEQNHNQLNFCFKDSASNWDNNNGENWTYAVTQ